MIAVLITRNVMESKRNDGRGRTLFSSSVKHTRNIYSAPLQQKDERHIMKY